MATRTNALVHPAYRWLRDNWLSVSFLLAVAGAVFFLGRLDGRISAIQETISVQDLVDLRTDVNKTRNDLTSFVSSEERRRREYATLFEALYYVIKDNHVEGEYVLDRLMRDTISPEARFMALELKSRAIWRRQSPEKWPVDLAQVAAEMVSLNDNAYNGYHWKGIAYFRMWVNDRNLEKELATAKSAFEKSLDLFPDQLKDRVNFAEICIVSGDTKRAEAETKKAIDQEVYGSIFDLALLRSLRAFNAVVAGDEDTPLYSEAIRELAQCPAHASQSYNVGILAEYLVSKRPSITARAYARADSLLNWIRNKSG